MTFTSPKFIGTFLVTLLLGVIVLAGAFQYFKLGGPKEENDPAVLVAQAEAAVEAVKKRQPGERRPASYDDVLRPLDHLLKLSRDFIHRLEYDPVADYDKLFSMVNPVMSIAAAANAQAQTETGPLVKDFRFNAQKAEAAQYLAAGLWSRTIARNRTAKSFGDAPENYPPAEVERALSVIDDGLEADPGNRILWTMRGAVHRATGLFAAAAKDLQRALELDPRDPETLNTLGLVHVNLKQFDKAEEHLEKARASALRIAEENRTNPGNEYTVIIFNLGRFHEGLAAFYARERRLAPSVENTRLMQKHASGARKYLGEFLSREPPDSSDASLARRLLEGLPSS